MPVNYYKSFKIEKNEYWWKVLTKKTYLPKST
jgi:hypothetical protein